MTNDKTESRANLRTALAVVSSLLIGGCTAGGAPAETTSVQCQEAEAGGFPAMSLVYEGGASGTLQIGSSLGEMALPATREEREGENEGATYTVTGIQAS